MTQAGKALLCCAGGGLGDSLLATLVARALRSRYAVVDALTLPAHRELLERVPDLDAVITDDGQKDAQLGATLAAQRYDAAVVTWATPRVSRVLVSARVPVRVGQARRLYSHRFTHRVPVRSEQGDVTTHWSQILLDYARALDCDTPPAPPRFTITPEDERQADALLREHGAPERFLMLHPANAIATARGPWPVSGWAGLANGLRERFALPVLISGSPSDRAIAQSIADQSGEQSIAGESAIGTFAALARRAQLFVGITTGTMHVAAAVGAPTVGIFPFQTDVPERWAPLGPRTRVVRASYPCRPGERKETCPDYACIAGLDVPRIVAAAQELRTAPPPINAQAVRAPE